MEWINGGAITVLILLIASYISYPKGGTRQRLEAELQQMTDNLNPNPPTKSELKQWAEDDRDTYIRAMAAFAMEESWWDKLNNRHWEQYLILNGRERVVTHNSDKTGYLD